MKCTIQHAAKAGALLTLSAAWVNMATADPYNLEFGATYQTGDADVDDIEINEDNFGVEGTYYFQTVDPEGGPLHEAPFLTRSSFITGSIDLLRVDDDLDNIVDTEGYSLSGKFINRENGWYGRLGYADADPDFDSVAGATAPIAGLAPEFSGFSVGVGRYILENTTFEVGYTQLSFDDESVFDNLFEGDTDTIGLGFRHFGPITDSIAYSIAAEYYFVDVQVSEFDDLDDNPFESDGDVYSLTAMIYPMYNLGFGISYADAEDLRGMPYLTSTTPNSDGLGLIADWFVTDSISIRAVYNNRDYDLSDGLDIEEPGEVDRDSLTFGARFRF